MPCLLVRGENGSYIGYKAIDNIETDKKVEIERIKEKYEIVERKELKKSVKMK